uniref:Uncharacterized protein n=1 Tax=Oryza sativa subsp. japonica TaxID=39947 RepID=Q6Z859_ORYSJ|nr:hypothetical protein [Oryza sativa Japonica Group]
MQTPADAFAVDAHSVLRIDLFIESASIPMSNLVHNLPNLIVNRWRSPLAQIQQQLPYLVTTAATSAMTVGGSNVHRRWERANLESGDGRAAGVLGFGIVQPAAAELGFLFENFIYIFCDFFCFCMWLA